VQTLVYGSLNITFCNHLTKTHQKLKIIQDIKLLRMLWASRILRLTLWNLMISKNKTPEVRIKQFHRIKPLRAKNFNSYYNTPISSIIKSIKWNNRHKKLKLRQDFHHPEKVIRITKLHQLERVHLFRDHPKNQRLERNMELRKRILLLIIKE
jgi:hypothetical protein